MAAVYFSAADITIHISFAVDRHVGFACLNEKRLSKAFSIGTYLHEDQTGPKANQIRTNMDQGLKFRPLYAVKLIRAGSNK